MSILLYDLAMTDGLRISPYCWRIRYALAHKGLAFETRPVGFSEIAALNAGPTVPVIEDCGNTVADSWAIVDHLEAAYPERPLFSAPAERALSRFADAWMETRIRQPLFRLYAVDVCNAVREDERGYYRANREERLGRTLEDSAADRAERLPAIRAELDPLRASLAETPFVSGAEPGYVDYCLASTFLWLAPVASTPVLAADDPLLAWFERVRGLYDGLAAEQPCEGLAA